jgi:hypothetical protein
MSVSAGEDRAGAARHRLCSRGERIWHSRVAEHSTERRGSDEIENLLFSSENFGAGDNKRGIPCFNTPSARVAHTAD